MDFDEIVGGIEDGMLLALKTAMDGMGVQSYATYSGDLDAENLKRSLAGFAKKCPRVMVAYANGDDIQDPKTSPVLGEPLHFRHDCWFHVIVAANDIRSERARRRGFRSKVGTYEMIAKVRETLTGLLIKKQVDDDLVRLIGTPFMPAFNDCVMRIPNMTAYVIAFKTYFRWQSPDRTAAGIDVTELVLDVNSLNALRENDGNTPGVEVGVGT